MIHSRENNVAIDKEVRSVTPRSSIVMCRYALSNNVPESCIQPTALMKNIAHQRSLSPPPRSAPDFRISSGFVTNSCE